MKWLRWLKWLWSFLFCYGGWLGSVLVVPGLFLWLFAVDDRGVRGMIPSHPHSTR
ncbi:hypothetical protein BDM02DRAFT_3264786 [Thelephora ganbajun]|uniref:Uncharacterized protein n=1 Tax=Thelephora ganbajun TaxID=370292 RepID=A0ACB6ZXS1_THEGA|nr:hypothetical protein BDM02DRAFT_3264786 [Thelephora ganbajun]